MGYGRCNGSSSFSTATSWTSTLTRQELRNLPVVKHLPDSSVDMDGMAQGRVQMCIGCHGAKQDNDYIFTGSLAQL